MSYLFDNSKYLSAEGAVDGSDAYGNKGYGIGFRHMISGEELYFKAFITAFNESYNSDWAVEQVYGRADGIYTFKNTSRSVTLAFKIPGFSPGEAYENLAKIQKLIQFLYPAYEDVNSATTITQSPLIRIKVMNLLQRNDNQGSVDTSNAKTLYESYKTGRGADDGTLGVITNLTVDHNLANNENSMIEKINSDGGESGATILPTFFDVNLDFKPIHHYPLGWFEGEGGNTFGTPHYPYGAFLEGDPAQGVDSQGSGTYPSEENPDGTSNESNNDGVEVKGDDPSEDGIPASEEDPDPNPNRARTGEGPTGNRSPISPTDLSRLDMTDTAYPNYKNFPKGVLKRTRRNRKDSDKT